MASIGERSAAFLAGNTPKMIPTSDETPTAIAMVIGSIVAGKNCRTISTTTVLMKSPDKPPISERIIDSVRNWVRMSLLSAPTARLMPISLMRSVTETYMIFMMPTPPTISDMAPIATRILFITPKIDVMVPSISVASIAENSSVLYRLPSNCFTLSTTTGTLFSDCALI